MKRPNIALINLLIAFIVGLIIVFPDISRRFEREVDFPISQQIRPRLNESNIPPTNTWKNQATTQPQTPNDEKRFHHHQRHITTCIIFNFASYFCLVLIFLFFCSRSFFLNKNNKIPEWKHIAISTIFCMIVGIAFVFIKSLLPYFHPPRNFHIDEIESFKTIFATIISLLSSYMITLIFRQQQMRLENERLKTENLQANYNILTAQINPHFFFNSLNALSALVREKQNEVSLKYINELSDIFRYVLNSNKKELVSLQQEIHFLNAYRYMLEIRYENKLFFDINIDEMKMQYLLPVLSLQPIVENTIKHNVVSESNPLCVFIYTSFDDCLVISNTISPKLCQDKKNGVGLKNLEERYQLLLSRSINVTNDNNIFCVKLPIIPSENQK